MAAAATLGTLASASSAMADPPGACVIGDQSAVIGSHVTFWGAQWWKDNLLSGGLAPAAFKGFADTASPQCDEVWTTRPGNSSSAPATVSDVIPVVVSSHIEQSGDVISGDTVEVAFVQVDPGYKSNPGHPGTGIVTRIVCGGGTDNDSSGGFALTTAAAAAPDPVRPGGVHSRSHKARRHRRAGLHRGTSTRR